jgi:hypothetical protein
MNPHALPTPPLSHPFPDGYDLEAERLALADLLQAEQPDESDPRWPRVIEYTERLRQLQQMQSAWRLRKGADAVVPDTEAAVQAGGLVDEAPDAMVLHTQEAHRLFMGRAGIPRATCSPSSAASGWPPPCVPSGTCPATTIPMPTGRSSTPASASSSSRRPGRTGARVRAAPGGCGQEGADLLHPEVPGAGLPGAGFPFSLRLHGGRPDRGVRLPGAPGQDPGAQGPDDRRRGPASSSGR